MQKESNELLLVPGQGLVEFLHCFGALFNKPRDFEFLLVSHRQWKAGSGLNQLNN